MNDRFAAAVCLAAILALPSFVKADEKQSAQPLPGTKLLTITGPLDEVMVEGIDRFALREIAKSVERRSTFWKRDYSSRQAYEKSIAANRERFRTIIGAADPRIKNAGFEVIATIGEKRVPVAESKSFVVIPVRWQVLEGVTGEGLLLHPRSNPPTARVIALPDADWTPEMFAGLEKGAALGGNIPRRLAENGCQVLVPTLISRDDTFSGHPYVTFTNQSHREFIYRMAFQMGRHVIGYEVQKVRSAVDIFQRMNKADKVDLPIGVVGVGEGGLLALYSAAVEPRIDAVMVSGYFQPREGVWKEPIYRNVWNLLGEFGDAEIASLIAPRRLVIEACAVPEVAGPRKPKPGRRGGAAPGTIATASLESVRSEFNRARQHYDKLKSGDRFVLTAREAGKGPAGAKAALGRFTIALGLDEPLKPMAGILKPTGRILDARARQKRQVDELVNFTQKLMEQSARFRDRYWSKADRSSVDKWVKTAEPYRNHVWDELIGRLPDPTMPVNARTRKVIDDPAFTAYEVVLDVYPDVIASGILLLPTGLKEGEKRPVVVCQHGLEGTPMDTITTEGPAYNYYKSFSVQLVKRGFIVYAPQNPYRGTDRFRTLVRKSNPMKRSLYTYILHQHQRTLEWLSSLPGVDPKRIGFYGLSYGGKTAVHIPPFLKQYALSICSADFDEWIRKNVSNVSRYSYIFTGEYEMFEWNMGHLVNHSELANLMAPRPFMVERGHYDGVAPDEWVAWEYAKVRRHYVELGLADKTKIEFFKGPHSINGVGTFEFLHKHLNWPKPD